MIPLESISLHLHLHLQNITLHYIYFTMPVTPKVTNGASTKSYSSSKTNLIRWVFNCCLEVSVLVSSWRLDRRVFFALGLENEKLRWPNLSFSLGIRHKNKCIRNCWKIFVSRNHLDRETVGFHQESLRLYPTLSRQIQLHGLRKATTQNPSECRPSRKCKNLWFSTNYINALVGTIVET